MMNNMARRYFTLLVREILEDHPIYSSILESDQSPWTLDDVVEGVRAVIATRGRDLDDGYNPDLDSALAAIVGPQDATFGGHYMIFSVVCEHVVDEIGG